MYVYYMYTCDIHVYPVVHRVCMPEVIAHRLSTIQNADKIVVPVGRNTKATIIQTLTIVKQRNQRNIMN